MAEEKKVSRRTFVGTIAGVAVAVGVGGFFGGWAAAPKQAVSPTGAAPTVTVTAPAGAAVTQTVTAPAAGVAAGKVKVGAGNPETGAFARDGQDANRSQVMALEELEIMWGGFLGGRGWEYINIDVPNKNTEEASAAIRRLVTRENVDVIVTDYITIDATEYEEANKHEIYYINQDTTGLGEQKVLNAGWKQFLGSQPTREGTNPVDTVPAWSQFDFWNCYIYDDVDHSYVKNIFYGIRTLIKTGAFKPINNKFASVAADNAYSFRIGKMWTEMMKWDGWIPAVDEVVVGGTVEWGPILSKIRADPPAVVFNTDVIARDMAAFITQFREDPTPSIVFGQYSPSVAEFLELTGDRAVGMGWQECMGQLHDETGLDFRQRFETRWGERPGMANTGVQYDFQVYAMALAQLVAPAGFKDPRRMASIVNSGVNFRKSDYVQRGVTGTWSLKPGQVGRMYPFEQPNLDGCFSTPHLSYQIQRRGGQQKGGTKVAGNVPTHVVVGPTRTAVWWHEKTGLGITDDGVGLNTRGELGNISKAYLAISDRFYSSGHWPYEGDGRLPTYADTGWAEPEWLRDVRPEVLRKAQG